MACDDCNRTDLLRRAIAEAGRGLPEIEPGMPLPAGTGLTRTAFVAQAAGLALAIYGGTRLSSRFLEDGIAGAATLPPQPILVSVFLEGGIDALSVLFPAGDPLYRQLRPSLALPASSGLPFAEDSRLLWHPSAAPLATLHGEGKVTVLPTVGYDHPDKSHFTSRHYWEVGATDPQLRTGWLGRYLDATGSTDNPLQGLSLDTGLQPALATARVPIASLDAPDNYRFSAKGSAARSRSRTGCSSRRARSAASMPPATTRRSARRARRPSRRTSSAGGCASSAPTSTLRSPTRSRPTSSRTGSPGSRR